MSALGKFIYDLAASHKERECRTATRRWRERNATQPRICPCGAPGTVVCRDCQNIGDEPVEFWRCAEHADTPINAQFVNGRRATRDECSFRISSISTGIISDCGCGTHIGELTR